MPVYGLIGQTLKHSFSKRYFNYKFKEEKLNDFEYQNFELKEFDKEIVALKENTELCGLNVTIPYKEQIMPYLDRISDDCREINACNCIEIKDGKWIGHNTDVLGFEKSFAPFLKSYHKKALILGTGGASKAVAFVLKKLGIEFLWVSRNPSDSDKVITYEKVDAELLSIYNIVINTTPLGMFPDIQSFPPLPYESISNQHYFFDLIYNPTKTIFLSLAEEKGAFIENGDKMLVIQAEESWRIWTGESE